MTFRVVVLPRAEADIEANARWWSENHSAEQAARWIDVIQQPLTSLAEIPESNGFSAKDDRTGSDRIRRVLELSIVDGTNRWRPAPVSQNRL